ncbi:unnamed protein product [Prorocentrum cordatum]|uniref:Uncharacterized protein n=1 Tax=Prorocentrum cordatum TaxID=2364126 RepID=A0ABN9SHT0_9DINO|nr:unnamed protein product [Polarella glacialis]
MEVCPARDGVKVSKQQVAWAAGARGPRKRWADDLSDPGGSVELPELLAWPTLGGESGGLAEHVRSRVVPNQAASQMAAGVAAMRKLAEDGGPRRADPGKRQETREKSRGEYGREVAPPERSGKSPPERSEDGCAERGGGSSKKVDDATGEGRWSGISNPSRRRSMLL